MARLDRIDGVATSSALRMFLCGGWKWGTGERKGGAQWKEAPVIFLWRDPHLLRCCVHSKDWVFLADSAGLADGLSRNLVGESASWQNGTGASGKSINQQLQNSEPNKTLHGPQPSFIHRSLARLRLFKLQRRCQWLHHFMARYYITYTITNDHQPVVLGLFVVGYNNPTPSTKHRDVNAQGACSHKSMGVFVGEAARSCQVSQNEDCFLLVMKN